MRRPKICLCLTGETLEEDLILLNKYRKYIDIAELRADYLTNDEQLQIRKFPQMAGLPCILTIRRTIDGGQYSGGEARRTTLFARALAFAEQDVSKNFAYIDLEEDYDVPSLQDAAFAFGTRVIRSYHCMTETVDDIAARMQRMRTTGFEIPKIACMPQSLSDVTSMFRQAQEIGDFEHILVSMSSIGLPTRILAHKLNSFLTYVSPIEKANNMPILGQLDPITLNEMYNFRALDAATVIYGITGYPLSASASPLFHNRWYRKVGLNAVYIPVKAQKVEEALDFAEQVGMQGLSVTIPHKETVIQDLQQISIEVAEINACNTVVRRGFDWTGFNTDAEGFKKAICEFLGVKTLMNKKVAIIGAGGAAKAIAYVIKQLHGKACVFNRTAGKARQLAEFYNFKWAKLCVENLEVIEDYSDIIIQTTSVGMGVSTENSDNDPLYFYQFRGNEAVYDIIYTPEKTPLLARAENAGCMVQNGLTMLEYQAEKQFLLFTGRNVKK